MKPANVSPKWGRLLLAALLALFVLASSGSLSAGVAHAEGSRDLYPSAATGCRANLEWRTSFYGPNNNFLRRRSLLGVYAEPGEVILVGSSAVGVGAADIVLYSSDQVTGRVGDETLTGPPDFSCEAQRTGPGGLPGQGQITSRAQELAGPQAVRGGENPNGYLPCSYEIPADGSADNIYYVAFYGPQGAASNVENFPSGRIDLVTGDPLDFGPGQNTSVSAWDVTVRSSLSSTEDITGRLFADYLAMITAGTSCPMFSTLYVLTTDAYIYEVGLRGLDPYGFVLYANEVGFLDSDGETPLLHDVVADPTIPVQEQNQLNVLLGDVSLGEPTHHLFFNKPSPEARRALNATDGWEGVDPIIPLIKSFVFKGVLGGNETLAGRGGTFVLDVNVEGRIDDLVISRDGVNFEPDNPSNRRLDVDDRAGRQRIRWDGLDNAGNKFGVGRYSATVRLRTGEIHFPLLDVENSQAGGPQYELTNPPDGCPPLAGGCFGGFYDDCGYRTMSGTDVGTPDVALPGVDPPLVPASNSNVGFDTRTEQRAFGDGSEAGFGDKKGLDVWTFYLTKDDTDVLITKKDRTPTPTPTPTPTRDIPYTETPTVPPTTTRWQTRTPSPFTVTPWATWTPLVVYLPETGGRPAPSPLYWLWLVLILLGLPAAWLIRYRRG